MTAVHNASTTTFVWLVSLCLLLLVIVGTAVTLHACKPSYRALEPAAAATATTIQHSAPSSCCCTNNRQRHCPNSSNTGPGTAGAAGAGISASSFQSGISTTGLVDTPTGCGIVTNEDSASTTTTMGARRSWSERVASAASAAAAANTTSNNNQQQQQSNTVADIIDTSDNNLKSCSASTTMFNNCYVSSVQHVPCLTSNNSLVSATIQQDISTSTTYSAAACCCPQFVEPHTVHQHSSSSSSSTTHPDKMLQVAQSAATLQPACSSHTAALRAHEQHLLSRSAQHSARVNLPPSISVPETQRNVFRYHVADQAGEVTQRCIRPPPNRTVYDRESPPPYQHHLHTEHGGHTPLLLHRSSHSSSRATTLLESDVVSESSCSVGCPSPSLSLESSSNEHRV